MTEVMRNRGFKGRLEELRTSYPKVAREPNWSTIEIASHMGRHSKYHPQAKEYRQHYLGVASDFGLHCDSATEELHRLVFFPYPLGLQTYDMERVEVIHTPVYPRSSKQDALRRFKKHLDRDWPEIQTRQKQAPDYQKGSRGHPKLKLHINWLYQRIALGKTPEEIRLGFPDRLEEAYPTKEPIRKAISRVASRMGISLPRSRPQRAA